MHEASLAGSILMLVEGAALRERFGRVSQLRLEVGRLAANGVLDGIEGGDAVEGLAGDRAFEALDEVEEFAPDMGPAGDFDDAGRVGGVGRLVELGEAGIGVGLKESGEGCEMPGGMLALAVGAVAVERIRRRAGTLNGRLRREGA